MYLRQTGSSFSEYLQMYEESWDDLARNSHELLEYRDRTLYSTWNLSLKRVQAHDPEAAQLLRLMAYFSNTHLWYELFQKGAASGPPWLVTIVKSKARFNKAISILREYSLVEVEAEARSGQYSLHTCVHDWTLEHLNHEIDGTLCGLAVHCIASNVIWEDEDEFWVTNRHLEQHVSRLEHRRLTESIDWDIVAVADISGLAYLNNNIGRMAEAEKMVVWALERYEKAWGMEHTSTLGMVYNLGTLYKKQGKMAEAEKINVRALEGYEKARGIEHTSTLGTVNNLGVLYEKQGKMAEAEKMYVRALEGYEKARGIEHTSTLSTVNNLGNLYKKQGKMAEAEKMYVRALEGYEKAWGVEHTLTLNTVKNLGSLYADQGKMAEAETMYQQALKGYQTALGPNHAKCQRLILAIAALDSPPGMTDTSFTFSVSAVCG
jgi:tetratricopeptide (TPR) repeat protein